MSRFRILLGIVACCVWPAIARAQLQDAALADYEQWRLAKQGTVAKPRSLTTLTDFEVELLRVAQPEEGSWISLTFDRRGRLIIGREDKGLLRMTLSRDSQTVAAVETIEDTLLEPRGVLYAYDSLYVHANNSKGLYRLRDLDGDDQFEKVELLKRTEGGVGHGRNALALGPDGMIYMAFGNNVIVPDDVSPKSPYRNYGIDRLLPCAWNEFLFDADVKPPCGFIARTDPDGKTFELVAGGFRNPYGIAFDRDGELFTYDADMEWDAGAPWYRPTTILHVIPGGEYGWRQETNCWPEWYADSAPRVIDIGLGSPTGVTFGHNSHFPVKYQKALFVLDWSYGRIIAVHETSTGGRTRPSVETFVKGKPLNVTDLAFGPDGALYFVVGGRRTQAALYRVRYSGNEQSATTPKTNPTAANSAGSPTAVKEPSGSSIDEQLAARHYRSADWRQRYQERLTLEQSPLEAFQTAALASRNATSAPTELLGLTRVARPESAEPVLARLSEWLNEKVDDPQRLVLLRAIQLAIIRLGYPTPKLKTELIHSLQLRYGPNAPAAERQMTCEILVALEAPQVASLTLNLFATATTQEEKLFYLFALRNVSNGWSLDDRRRYFAELKRAETFQGAHYLQRFVTFIRSDALATLSDPERRALAPAIKSLGRSPDAATGPLQATRPELHKWTLPNLTSALDKLTTAPDVARGRELFAEALCIRCHRKADRGQPLGPDLDYVASRFGRDDLLETIVAPSKVVDEKYRNLVLETSDGKIITGQLVGGSATELFIGPDPLDPVQFVKVRRDSITSRKSSPTSIMPEGLLNGFTAAEIQDLLAYLVTR
ncbi:MAG: c-type cytochrome [Planctomycetes bacterium]|nr:c-type cytochrome [Planctomycetota bacterium]